MNIRKQTNNYSYDHGRRYNQFGYLLNYYSTHNQPGILPKAVQYLKAPERVPDKVVSRHGKLRIGNGAYK